MGNTCIVNCIVQMIEIANDNASYTLGKRIGLKPKCVLAVGRLPVKRPMQKECNLCVVSERQNTPHAMQVHNVPKIMDY